MAAVTLRRCDICLDGCAAELVPDTCAAHRMCHSCIFESFHAAVVSESAYPPKCCKDGLLKNAYLDIFDPDFGTRYVAKQTEYATPPKLRTYCSNTQCGKFINTSRDKIVNCGECETATCSGCRLTVDLDTVHRCQGLQEDQSLEEFASKGGLKHCPKCHILIELGEACNHMTCTYCGQGFCFVCLLPYSSSDSFHNCPQYGSPDYDNDGYDWRGLHRDTGLDRDGFNRRGYNDAGLDRNGNPKPVDDDDDDNNDDDDDPEDELGDVQPVHDEAFQDLGLTEEEIEEARIMLEIANAETAVAAAGDHDGDESESDDGGEEAGAGQNDGNGDNANEDGATSEIHDSDDGSDEGDGDGGWDLPAGNNGWAPGWEPDGWENAGQDVVWGSGGAYTAWTTWVWPEWLDSDDWADWADWEVGGGTDNNHEDQHQEVAAHGAQDEDQEPRPGGEQDDGWE